jgi:phosphoribosylformimino-5-aminoimidazole carboxamide ribotide isomerase
MEIIPAIDIIDGKCVRLTQGDYNQKKEYSDDPLDVAKQYEDAGIRRLHLVDLDGAKQKKIINHKVLEIIAGNTRLSIDFGGGIQSDHDIEIAFNSGAKQVTGGSVAIKNPPLFQEWLEKYGPDRIILGADAKDRKIAVSGWQEQTNTPISEFLDHHVKMGIKYSICTDVAKDGLLEGPSIELYKEIINDFPTLHLIASGGVSSLQDLEDLAELKVFGVIIGKAIYEKRITLKDLTRFL